MGAPVWALVSGKYPGFGARTADAVHVGPGSGKYRPK
jgi:hypothetical protein